MRRIGIVVVLGVLAASGAYALIYLFRWEWHRAIITALFFVAAEVGLGVALVLRRLARLEKRLDAMAERPAAGELDPSVLARIREAAPPARSHFEWLDPRKPTVGVFLPFLLGVGALASALAWLVEQLARRTTAPLLERRLARRLAPLALPADGLLGPPPAPASSAAPTRGGPRALRTVLVAGAAVAVVGIATIGVGWLADSIQSRPDAPAEHVATRIEIELRGARSAARPEQAAATLWGTCSQVLHGTVGAADVHHLGGARVEVLVPTDIGTHAEQRVRGCLQDALVDRVQATVVALEPIPAARG